MPKYTVYEELKRRNVIKAAITYGAISWALIEAGSIIFPELGFPEYSLRFLLIALVIGFPAWLIFSWVYEYTPEGFRKTEDLGEDSVVSEKTNKRLNVVIIGGLLIAVVLLLADRFTDTSNSDVTPQVVISANSIAVLPFTSMSAGDDNQFFSDGMHDDLLTHLSKISDMKVVSRTSVLRFRNTEQPIKEIAGLLGVANILEGSVRREGNMVRINVQLIEAASDDHLWAEIYDRELTTSNIFEIQNEITNKIAQALKTTISPVQRQALSKRPTDDLQAYEDYLRARQFMDLRSSESLIEARTLFEKALARDPDFVLATIHLATVEALLPTYGLYDRTEQFEKAWTLLNQVKPVTDSLVEAHALEGFLYYIDKQDLSAATEAFEKALTLNPNYAPTYMWYANAILEIGGDREKALGILRRGLEINPLSPRLINNYAFYLGESGQFDDAIKTFRKGIRVEPEYQQFWINLSSLYRNQLGRADSAVMVAHQAMSYREGQVSALSNLLFCLEELGMSDEVGKILQTTSFKNRDDSLWYYIHSAERANILRDFDEVIDIFTTVKSVYDFDDKFSIGKALFDKGDFSATVDLYERNYPKVENGEHLGPFAFFAYRAFQEYIYALHQLGKDERAADLWDSFADRILYTPEGVDEYYVESRYRSYYQIRHALANNEIDRGLDLLENFFDNGVIASWQAVERDPHFDAVRNNARYVRIMNDVHAIVEDQKSRVRAFLQAQ